MHNRVLDGGKKMKRKIIGIFVCMLMIATVLPVAANVSETENEPQIHSDVWTWDWLCIGFIRELDDQYWNNLIDFRAVLMFVSLRIMGEIDHRTINFGGTGFGFNYDLRKGYVGEHFICCRFCYD